ncbi:hypothetical protein AB0D11_39425 [Streptomyces monashensis]|uniref:hypothetical protein n=1 Tax=Streptomyces monashensis TaxID=1678012 RepID=UPI0033F247D0
MADGFGELGDVSGSGRLEGVEPLVEGACAVAGAGGAVGESDRMEVAADTGEAAGAQVGVGRERYAAQ